MKKFASGLFFSLFYVFPLLGVNVQNTPAECQWRIGVFEFMAAGDNGILLNLKNTIPREILAGLSGTIRHRLTLEDKKILAEKTYRKSLVQLGQELSLLYNKRDLLFLSGKIKKKGRDKIIEEIVEKKAEIASLKGSLDASCHSASLEIKINPGNENSPYPLIADSLKSIPLSKNLEMAVYGKLAMVDQWLSVSVYLYNYLTGNEGLIYQNLLDPAAVHDTLSEIILKLKEKITGEDPPVLFVKGNPSDAFFNLDEGENNLTNTPLSLFPPGTYNLHIHQKGYLPLVQNIILQSGQEDIVPYSLQREKTGFISLSTFPAGADIYSGSLWIGKSPFILTDPVFPLYITFNAEGYHPLRSIIDGNSSIRNTRYFLVPEKINIDRMIDIHRKSFYNSFAFFVISLSIPVVSYGISSDYGYAFNTFIKTNIISTDSLLKEEHRLMDASTLWYNLYLGGIFISASLFINTAVELWNYIKLYN